MKERLLKLAVKYAALIGYPLFYIACLGIFASLTFPYDKLKERVIATFNAQQRPGAGQEELQIDEMSGYRLSGVRVKGVRLLSAGDPGKPPSKIQIEEATVRYAMLPALIGSSDVTFDVNAFGGEASGTYEIHGADKSIDVTFDGIELGQLDPVVQLLGVPLQGRLGGTMRLAMPEGKASKATGTLSLEATDVGVGDGKAKVGSGMFMMALPRVAVGKLTFAGEAKDGAFKITKFAAGGQDVEVQGDGRITLRDVPAESLFDGQARFKINDAYRNRSDLNKGLVLGLDMSPDVKQSKRPDGFYAWTLRGPLGHLAHIPAGGGGTALPSGSGLGAPKVNP